MHAEAIRILVHRVAHRWHRLLLMVALIIIIKFVPPIELMRTGRLTHRGPARRIIPAHRTQHTHGLIVQVIGIGTNLLHRIGHRLIEIRILINQINIGHRVQLRIRHSISILIHEWLRSKCLLKRLIRAHLTNHIRASFWAFNPNIRTVRLCSALLAFLGLLLRYWEASNQLWRGNGTHWGWVFPDCLLVLAVILSKLVPQAVEILS